MPPTLFRAPTVTVEGVWLLVVSQMSEPRDQRQPNTVDSLVCPVCKQPCESFQTSFSKEGTWCNHAGWVLRTGATRGDPPILGGVSDA